MRVIGHAHMLKIDDFLGIFKTFNKEKIYNWKDHQGSFYSMPELPWRTRHSYKKFTSTVPVLPSQRLQSYIFYLKVGIRSSVWSTKICLYDIMEPRYKQNNLWYQISRILNYEQSNTLKSDIFSRYEHFRRKGYSLGLFQVQTHLCTT